MNDLSYYLLWNPSFILCTMYHLAPAWSYHAFGWNAALFLLAVPVSIHAKTFFTEGLENIPWQHLTSGLKKGTVLIYRLRHSIFQNAVFLRESEKWEFSTIYRNTQSWCVAIRKNRALPFFTDSAFYLNLHCDTLEGFYFREQNGENSNRAYNEEKTFYELIFDLFSFKKVVPFIVYLL